MTEQRWDQLCLQRESAQEIAEQVRATLLRHGYAPYDPFHGGSGTPPRLKQFVRLFILPPQDSWTRIIGAQDADVLPDLLRTLSADALLIHAWFTAQNGALDAYKNGEADSALLAPYLSGATQYVTAPQSATLPSDVAKLAQTHGVNPQQAEKLIGRLARGIFGDQTARVQRDAAQLFKSAWESAGGQQLLAQIARLSLPFDLRTPDFETLREAYQAARLLARRPNATLLDSERAALRAVPYAAALIPVYVGK
ncbi:MAG: hypothetical protein NZ571_02010 [Anaerolineae bacterium]|nr:hypothetical protein [Anaerolineae bacterium]